MTDKVSESPESTRCKVHKAAQDPGYCQNTLLRIRTRVQSGQIGFISDWVAPPPLLNRSFRVAGITPVMKRSFFRLFSTLAGLPGAGR